MTDTGDHSHDEMTRRSEANAPRGNRALLMIGSLVALAVIVVVVVWVVLYQAAS